MTAAERLAEALRRARREALAPPPRLSLSEWAACTRGCRPAPTPCPAGSKPSPINVAGLTPSPTPAVRQVTVMKSARVGYTRCLDHAVGYFIHQDPSPVLFVMPRIEDCEDFSRTEILPMLTDTPALAALVGDIKTRDASQRILKRQFRNGASVAFVGANSPAGFRRISARVVLFDETDGFPLEVGFEGDQIALGIKRTGDVLEPKNRARHDADPEISEPDREGVCRFRSALFPRAMSRLRALSNLAIRKSALEQGARWHASAGDGAFCLRAQRLHYRGAPQAGDDRGRPLGRAESRSTAMPASICGPRTRCSRMRAGRTSRPNFSPPVKTRSCCGRSSTPRAGKFTRSVAPAGRGKS